MRRKVLFVSIDGFKNDSRMTKQAITLAQAGYEVKIITIHKEDLKEEEKSEFFEVKRIKLKSKNWSKLKIVQILKMYEFNIKIIEYLKKENFIPDIVQSFTPYPLEVAFTIKRKINSNVKIVYDPREYVRAQNINKTNKLIMLYLERKYIKQINKIITVGDFIADFYQKDYSLEERPTVLRNIPFYYKKIEKNKNYLKEKLNISNKKRILLYQGALMKGRGLEKLLYILSNLPENFVLVFMGEGILKNDLKLKIKELKIEDRIFFMLVDNKELLKYTSSADIGMCLIENICKSYYYCLPNKFFEYIQSEIPIICSDFPEMEKLINDYKIGKVSSPENIKEITKNILELITKKDEKIEINLKIAKMELCWENEEKKLLSLYESLKN